ncbi:U4/U6.U5 tri-snRNP-associated protein 2 [Dinochytrium kinnereticum]|nr:U4/U6.U5 tri-snRNP-associated protein 2 [Dinochytrium kinnereticum]
MSELSDDDQPRLRKKVKHDGHSGLFLDTVNRYMLDFDFEKLCSVSLSNLNVYACLVCGKYFQGRGPTSHAYFHSVHEDHHVFVNLESLKVYILPDGYEAVDASLNDIKFVIRPTFTVGQIEAMDKSMQYSYDLNNKRYLPGFVGLNNIKANDYVNVIIQALSHIRPLRDFFLANDNLAGSELGIIHEIFQGDLEVEEQDLSNLSRSRLAERPSNDFFKGIEVTKKTLPFLYLTLDLPPPPLFQDDAEKNIIPQENNNRLTRMKLKRLPKYLAFHIKRFTKNNFAMEKNPTIVNFPLKNLDMSECVQDIGGARYDLVANICHEGRQGPKKGTYKIHVVSKGRDQWFQLQDLIVEEIAPQMIFLSESYIQVKHLLTFMTLTSLKIWEKA